MSGDYLQQRRAEAAEARLNALLSGDLREYSAATLDTLDGDAVRLAEWTKSWPTPRYRNVVVGGPTGSGKTYAAVALLRHAVEGGHRAAFVRYFDYLAALRPDGEQPHWKVRRDAMSPWLLVMDDLGAEVNTLATEAARREMVELMTARNARQYLTVVTTNLKPDQVELVFGERFFSRINADGFGVRVGGPDRRGPRISW